MSGSGGAPLEGTFSAVPPGLDDFRLRTGSDGSALSGGVQRGSKRVATSPPQGDNLHMEPPPLSEREVREMKKVLLGHDYSFSSINACSKESAAKKKEMEEIMGAYRRAVDTLAAAYIRVMTEREVTSRVWKMIKSVAEDRSRRGEDLEMAEVVRESAGAAVRCVLNEERTSEIERTRVIATEVATTIGERIESGVRQAVESALGSSLVLGGSRDSGRSYAGAVRSSVPGPGPRLPGEQDGASFSGNAQRKVGTIEIVPGENMESRCPDASATCSAVLGSIKPVEMGIKIDRVVKGRNKSVRIVAGHEELDKLKPVLNQMGMEVKTIDKLNPRLRVRDIPTGLDKQQFISDLVRQNLSGADASSVRLVYWFPTKAQRSASAIIEVSSTIRTELMSQGRVYLGWSSCRVMDHLHVLQCFKCLGFGHMAKGCQASDVCGYCTGGHESRACPNKGGVRKCHNCVSAKMRVVDHSALDAVVCPVLQRRLTERSKMIHY